MRQTPAASCRKVTPRFRPHERKDKETAKKIRVSRRRKAQAAADLQAVEGHRRRDRGGENENEGKWIRSNIRAELVENI
jgi:hypothetical protein